MIIYRKGDAIKALKDGEIDILAHGCNCVGGFGAGIAGQIAKEFPVAKECYLEVAQEYKEIPNDLLGLIHSVDLDDKKYIINCFTQLEYYPRNKVHLDYDALKECMEGINKSKEFKKLKIGMPKIGAGLAGGDWEKIEEIINSVFDKRDIFVYEL